MNLFKKVSCTMGQHLTKQGNQGDKVYIILTGQCSLIKKLKMTKSVEAKTQIYESFEICKISNNAFIGEEILLDKDVDIYEYDVIVSSLDFKCFMIERKQFFNNFPEDSMNHISERFFMK
jgi:hypothetical protein